MTPDEQRAVFKASFNEMDKIYVYIIYGCGLRCGEALALTEADFDLEAHTVSIDKITRHIRQHTKEKTVKTYRTEKEHYRYQITYSIQSLVT